MRADWVVDIIGGWVKRLVCPREGLRIQFHVLLRARALPAMTATKLPKLFNRLALECMKRVLPYLVVDFP